MERKITIYSEVNYNGDQTDTKLLSDRNFTVGDINSIIECINETIEEVSRNYIAIEHAATFFNITFSIRSITFNVTSIDGEVVETITVNNLEELTRLTDLITSLCK